ncbi:MAG: DUF3703 domain-containing protein [Acidobacteriota bacterium]
MSNEVYANHINKYVDAEIETASGFLKHNDLSSAFKHLERAHVLGQAVTVEHTRVHWLMLKIGWRKRDWREVLGQIFRVVGASTKTPFGIYPKGNTGGANISPFKPMPIPSDLQEIIRKAKTENI